MKWRFLWISLILVQLHYCPAAVGQEQLQTQRWPLSLSPPTWSCTPSPQAGCHVLPPPTACSNRCCSGIRFLLCNSVLSCNNTPKESEEQIALHISLLLKVFIKKENGICDCVCRYQGYIGAALVLGGVDCNGPHLYSIYPHGSTDKLPYVTMGQCHTLLYTSHV